MKKANNNRYQRMKLFLILNDFYRILVYLRQPFFKLGNKTAQQITNLPIFFSLFFLSLGILQISFDTRNSSILKNYPLFTHLTNRKIPQKFDTLYLQLLENKEMQKKRKEDQLDFFQYQPEFPTIFHSIQNEKQKQDIINLYKTFEQIGPIFLSEIEEKNKDQGNGNEELSFPTNGNFTNAILHLGIDIPYQIWSSKTKNFNSAEDKLLTSWQFKDSDLIIRDLKADNEFQNRIVQQFLKQYNTYLDMYIKNINLKLFKNKNIQITKNLEKIFVKIPISIPEKGSIIDILNLSTSQNIFKYEMQNSYKRNEMADKQYQKQVIKGSHRNILNFTTLDTSYQIQKIEDQIPRKIQGSRDFIPEKRTSLFPVAATTTGEYQEEEYEILSYKKENWKNFLQQLSNLHVESPSFMEGYRQHKKSDLSLFNVKLPQGKTKFAKTLLDFLELTKIPKYTNILKKFKKLQLLKYIGQFDIEIIEGDNDNYILELRTLHQNSLRKLSPIPNFFYEFESQNEENYGDTGPDTFDNYQNTYSDLLQRQKDNPYFEELISAEDYLLETIFFFIKNNLVKNNHRKEQSKEGQAGEKVLKLPRCLKRKRSGKRDQKQLKSELAPKAYHPSLVMALDFLKSRKKQRNLFLKNYEKISQIKNLLEKKREIQTSFLYNSIYYHYLLNSKILKNIHFEQFEQTEQQYAQCSIDSLANKQKFYDELKNFGSKFNHPFPSVDIASNILIYLKKYLNFDLFLRRTIGETSNSFSLQGQKIYPMMVNLIKSHNKNKPYEYMGRYYFYRKLPRVPKNIDFPVLVINKTHPFKKKSYPFRIENIPRMTSFKKKKIKRAQEIFSILRAFNPTNILNRKNFDYFYNQFHYKMDNKILKSFYSYNEITDTYTFQNQNFETAIDEILNDFYYKNGEVYRAQKCLGQKQSIYQSTLLRQMSGYLFADIQRRNLPRILLGRPSGNSLSMRIEIPISNMDVSNFVKKLPGIHEFGHSLKPNFRIFKYQQKISQKGFDQFFEFRENFNYYSWSILFFFSSGLVFVHIFQNLYKKYAKEFVESGIDFLKRAGILDDVQWIKEELGMTPIDKGYRGIRHHGKKFKNIIGLDRQHLHISEMVWFLKTKKLIQSPDLFVPIILFLNSRNILIKRQKPLLPTKEISILQLPQLPKLRQNSEIEAEETSTLRPFRLSSRWKYFEKSEKPDSIASTSKTYPSISKISQHSVKPKGFLFIGPPGTGKTLLVQAIAGETGVPVVTQSGGLLQNPRLRGKGVQTLHKLFLRAREIAPCIIFIDEVDGIGTRRQFLPLYIDIHGRYDPVEWLESEERFLPPKIVPTKIERRSEFFDDHDPYWKEPEFTQTLQSARIPIDVLQDMQFSRGARSEQLSILTQLLIELDGIHVLENILVIGATNRFEILDPALMRPGRFQRNIIFNLPDYVARINLFKFYTQQSKIGIEDLSWDYLSKRTQGLSSADIASIVFASELTAVQQSKRHTYETLERGIDLITSFPSDPVMFRLKNTFVVLDNFLQKFFEKNNFYTKQKLNIPPSGWDPKGEFLPLTTLQETSNVLRNCYYNIGKIVLLFCLQIMGSSSAYISLWERPKNFRFFFFTKTFNEFNEFDQKMLSRKEIEKRLLVFFGGKAAESLFIFLPLNKFSSEIYFKFNQTFISMTNSVEQSNFGIESEIQTAQSLLKLMVEKWYFYLERIATEKFHPILENANLWEYPESENLLGQALVDEIIIDLDMRNRLSKNEQKHSYQAWWMKKVATQLNYRQNFNLLWSRIYLSDPEYSAQNIEWVAPDEYFHTLYRTRPDCMAWSHFLENGRFAVSNVLLLQSFNFVFKTLRQFSEFMDFLADYFLRYECVRETEFQGRIKQFFYYY